MPEGPSIVQLKEIVAPFTGRKITAMAGNSTIDQGRLLNKKVLAFRSWGKHFLICFKGFSLKVHFLLFGSYLVNATKDRPLRLGLTFSKGSLNFYAAAIKFIEGDIEGQYDFTSDVMNDDWNPKKALAKLKENQQTLVCDALLEQEIFSGVGNIIKNEVLYRARVHPLSRVGALPAIKLKELVRETRKYSFEFLEWKRQGLLTKHWLAHRKKTCLRCDLLLSSAITGTKKRRSFFCNNCHQLYE